RLESGCSIVEPHNLRATHADGEFRGRVVQTTCKIKHVPFLALRAMKRLPGSIRREPPLVPRPDFVAGIAEMLIKPGLVILAPIGAEHMILKPNFQPPIRTKPFAARFDEKDGDRHTGINA